VGSASALGETHQSLSDLKQIMANGDTFIGYGYNPSTNQFFKSEIWLVYTLDDSAGRLCWCDPTRKDTTTNMSSLRFEEINEMFIGKQTATMLQPGAESAQDECCFSIIGGNYALDLEAKSTDVMKTWMDGFSRILAQCKQVAFADDTASEMESVNGDLSDPIWKCVKCEYPSNPAANLFCVTCDAPRSRHKAPHLSIEGKVVHRGRSSNARLMGAEREELIKLRNLKEYHLKLLSDLRAREQKALREKSVGLKDLSKYKQQAAVYSAKINQAAALQRVVEKQKSQLIDLRKEKELSITFMETQLTELRKDNARLMRSKQEDALNLDHMESEINKAVEDRENMRVKKNKALHLVKEMQEQQEQFGPAWGADAHEKSSELQRLRDQDKQSTALTNRLAKRLIELEEELGNIKAQRGASSSFSQNYSSAAGADGGGASVVQLQRELAASRAKVKSLSELIAIDAGSSSGAQLASVNMNHPGGASSATEY
jgi:hypothetical protein